MARVEETAPVGEIGTGQQKLRNGRVAFVEGAAVSTHQKALADRRRRLLFGQANSALTPDDIEPGANGARRHDHDPPVLFTQQ